jgi:putative YphP/YqiW family bacilliredoxin
METLKQRPMYDPEAVRPMREDLVRVGVRELLTPEDVTESLEAPGTTLVIVNSICGCAAGGARPGAMIALQHTVIPDRLTTVFAGMEREATEKARSYFKGYAPSSPSIAVLEDGQVVGMLERRDIEGRSPAEIAGKLTAIFDVHCSRPGPSIPREEFEKIIPVRMCGSSIQRL